MQASLSIGDFWKFLLLRTEAFDRLRRSPGSLWFSLRLFVLAGLLGTIGLLVSGLASAGEVSFSDRLAGAASSAEAFAAGWPQRFAPRLAEAMTAIADRLQGAAAAVESVEPPLGPSTSRSLRAIGNWLTQPFLSLTAWLTAILPFLLVARLLGGRGSLRQQTSLILLAFLPQALALLASVDTEPGSTTAMAATAVKLGAGLWSLVILVTGLSIANGFGRARAAAALLATVLVVAATSALVAFLIDRLAGPLLSLLL